MKYNITFVCESAKTMVEEVKVRTRGGLPRMISRGDCLASILRRPKIEEGIEVEFNLMCMKPCDILSKGCDLINVEQARVFNLELGYCPENVLFPVTNLYCVVCDTQRDFHLVQFVSQFTGSNSLAEMICFDTSMKKWMNSDDIRKLLHASVTASAFLDNLIVDDVRSSELCPTNMRDHLESCIASINPEEYYAIEEILEHLMKGAGWDSWSEENLRALYYELKKYIDYIYSRPEEEVQRFDGDLAYVLTRIKNQVAGVLDIRKRESRGRRPTPEDALRSFVGNWPW